MNYLVVKLEDDVNYIPVKYAMLGSAPASTLTGTDLILMTVRVGWDTKEHYDAFVARRETAGMQGRVGEFLGGFKLSDVLFYESGYEFTPSRDM
jgi:hypothetical protein